MRVYGDAAQAAKGCALQIAEWLKEAAAERNLAHLAVSGGATPRLMLSELASMPLPWSSIHLYQVDERGVPPDHEQSNYRMIRQALIEPARLPEENVHRMFGEMHAPEAASRYADDLLRITRGAPLDVVQCGIGDDGHTASLFPGDELVCDQRGLVAGVFVKDKKQWRITLLPRPILDARRLCVLATGAGKALAIGRALQDPIDLRQIPAQLLRRGEWFVDEAAATSSP
jgi:6-phosphogluconolactonase